MSGSVHPTQTWSLETLDCTIFLADAWIERVTGPSDLRRLNPAVFPFFWVRCGDQASGGGGSQKGGNVDDGQPSLDLASDARERCQTRLLTLLAHEANRHAAQLHQGDGAGAGLGAHLTILLSGTYRFEL